MAQPCIFCGEKANSHEHAIPKWVGKRLKLASEELSLVYAEDSTPRRKQPIRFGSHRARILCRGCNAHFKHMEDEAADLVEWMARGRSITLGETEQDVLARWGAKTAYAILSASSEDFRLGVPVEHRRVLRFENRVHDLSWIGYASWGGYIHRVVMTGPMEGRAERPIPHAYSIVLTFAGIGLKVFGVADPVPGHALALDTPTLKQVWPRLGRQIAWPLSPGRDENLKELVELVPLEESP